jgi:hypothetical protein
MLPVICDGFEDEGIFSTCRHWSELFETTLPFRRENLLFTPSSLEEFKSIFRSVSPLERVCDSESPNEDLSFGRLCLTIGTRTCSSCFNTFDDTDHWTICEMCGSTVPMPKSAVALRHFIVNLSRARHFHTGCMITVGTVAQHIWNSFLVAHAPTLEHLEVTACFSILPQSARFTNLRSLVLVVKYDFGGGSSTQTPTSIQESGAWSSLPIVTPNLENLSLIRNHSRYIGSSFFGISPMSNAKASTQKLPPLRPELAFLLKLHRLRELTLEHPFLHPISGLELSQLFMSPNMQQIEKLCITEDLTKLTERNWRFRYLKTDLVNLKQVILKDVVAPAFVSDLTSRSPNLQFLEVAFPKKIVSDDSWFEVCESLRVNCLQLRDFTHLNTRCSELTFAASASLKNLSHIRNVPLLPCTAPVPIVGIPRWLSSILISTLHVLDLEHCDFKVTSAIASIVSESCLLLRNLTFPRKLGSATGSIRSLSLSFLKILVIFNASVNFLDIESLCQRSPLLKKFAAFGNCSGDGLSSAGIYHLYSNCLRLVDLDCSRCKLASPNDLYLTLLHFDNRLGRSDDILLELEESKDDTCIRVGQICGSGLCQICEDDIDIDVEDYENTPPCKECPRCEKLRCLSCSDANNYVCSTCGDEYLCSDCISQGEGQSSSLYFCDECAHSVVCLESPASSSLKQGPSEKKERPSPKRSKLM